ncbi:hypothetical protein H206_05198 [Candidatus Electrothrix aarhusensis]|uniref:Uncharacterized protein n=1 Tax=Candidatus Electrothrix aarhusensis TaxID=1859131 RepID=A0A3S3QIE2_9BACT|nr:hypothetical protein H206_05198 [Candidatus Electrothrix aarhusensis]
MFSLLFSGLFHHCNNSLFYKIYCDPSMKTHLLNLDYTYQL